MSTPERFIRATAAWIEGATETTATWDVSAVLGVVADIAGEDLMHAVQFTAARSNGQRPHRWCPGCC
jgi:hypothetical protein